MKNTAFNRNTALLSTNTLRTSSIVPMAAILFAVLALCACSGGSGGEEEPPRNPDAGPLPDDETGSEPLPDVLQKLKNDSSVISPVPDIAYTLTTAKVGVQISWTQESLRAKATANSIEDQWIFMQDCVGQNSASPLIIIRDGLAEPFTPADDVVRNEQISETEITSVPIASSSSLYGPVVQVSVSDFDGSLGTPLFNLRSILGRYLWLSNDLPERDYPFECAREQP